MMAYTSFDIRSAIRSQIGYTHYMLGSDLSTVSVNDKLDDKVYLPLYLPSDCRTGDLPPLPFIEMTLVHTPSSTHNIQGDAKFQEAYIDFNIYYTDMENINASAFGKKVADELLDKITESRASVTGSYFVEIINEGREILEEYEKGKSLVFHRVVECKAMNITKG